MNTQRTALLDGDIIAYQTAAWAHARQVDGSDMIDRLWSQVEDWTKRAFCQRAIVCLSCPRDENFRRDHWPAYKAHRDDHQDPPGRISCVETLRTEFLSMVRPRIEADDLLGILGSRSALADGTVPVIVTIDKDLRQIPGWHFNPDKDDFPVRVTEAEADLFFHTQWLMGDPTDNIPGLFRWGPAKASALLADLPADQHSGAVLAAYKDHPKGYPEGYALAMARCVRILRDTEWDVAKQVPILWTPTTA